MPKVAFLTSGGIAPCLSASIGGLIEKYNQLDSDIEMIGYMHGYRGLLLGKSVVFSKEVKDNFHVLYDFGGSPIGNSRVKLTNIEDCIKKGYVSKGQDPLEVAAKQLEKDNIDILHTIGGDDTNTMAAALAAHLEKSGKTLTVVGLPKTVDNDLPITDNCPGFGSVAKYIAVSTREASFDVASMAKTSTKVFILEVMGRHAGWIAAAGGMASDDDTQIPIVILFPEVTFNRKRFMALVAKKVKRFGYCSVVVSEGVRSRNGGFLADQGLRDAFGHAQLGGVAPVVAGMVKEDLGLKYHWAVADYLQRSARHIASKSDVAHAYATGAAAVKMALAGKNAVMPTIVRVSDQPYRWKVGEANLKRVANKEKMMPRSFISTDGFGITARCRRYLEPLIRGEDYPPYQKNGLPKYVQLKNVAVKKKLAESFKV